MVDADGCAYAPPPFPNFPLVRAACSVRVSAVDLKMGICAFDFRCMCARLQSQAVHTFARRTWC